MSQLCADGCGELLGEDRVDVHGALMRPECAPLGEDDPAHPFTEEHVDVCDHCARVLTDEQLVKLGLLL